MRYIRNITRALFVLTLVLWVLSWFLINRNTDKENPVISSDSDTLRISVEDDESRLMEGLKAWDDRDGDLTDDIMIGSRSKFISPGTAEITYLVFDSGNNVGSYTRRVEYTDYEPPVFSLNGPLIFSPGDKVSVQDYLTVTDCIEGDISDKVKVVSSDVDSSAAGDYSINVEVVNDYGDKISAELPVVMISKGSNTVKIELSSYLVYVKAGERFSSGSWLKKVTLADGTAGDRDNVMVSSNVNTAVPGSYTVKYVYSDEASNSGCTVLAVIVTE